MTAKYDDFMVELEELCKKHQVCISVSEYAALQIFDMDDDDEIIHSAGIQDMTEGSEVSPA